MCVCVCVCVCVCSYVISSWYAVFPNHSYSVRVCVCVCVLSPSNTPPPKPTHTTPHNHFIIQASLSIYFHLFSVLSPLRQLHLSSPLLTHLYILFYFIFLFLLAKFPLFAPALNQSACHFPSVTKHCYFYLKFKTHL